MSESKQQTEERLHKLGCDEYHNHQAPKCCRSDCWCLQQQTETGPRMEAKCPESKNGRHLFGTSNLGVCAHCGMDVDDARPSTRNEPEIPEVITHRRNCPAWISDTGHEVNGEDCTCGYRWRIEITSLRAALSEATAQRDRWKRQADDYECVLDAIREAFGWESTHWLCMADAAKIELEKLRTGRIEAERQLEEANRKLEEAVAERNEIAEAKRQFSDEAQTAALALSAKLQAAEKERDKAVDAIEGLLPGIDDYWRTLPEGRAALAAARASLPMSEKQPK